MQLPALDHLERLRRIARSETFRVAVGPGRQIADKSYYLTRLRSKKQELQAEIDSLNSEMSRFQKDDSTSTQLERK
jgi:uncharacterized protein YlxW (UPF0749 family)